MGRRIVKVKAKGKALDPARSYTVTVNSFLAAGGDGFTAFRSETNPVTGATDIDALIAFLGRQAQPVTAPRGGRINLR